MKGENTLKMDRFHRPIKQQKKQSNKKKARDLERLLLRNNLPENVRQEKLEELKTLKNQTRKAKDALRLQDKYKKIKGQVYRLAVCKVLHCNNPRVWDNVDA